MKNENPNKSFCDVTNLIKGDIVYYSNYDNGKFLIDRGILKGNNIYSDGVQVHGDGWKQYVSKYFIVKVERGGQVIFEDEEFGHD